MNKADLSLLRFKVQRFLHARLPIKSTVIPIEGPEDMIGLAYEGQAKINRWVIRSCPGGFSVVRETLPGVPDRDPVVFSRASKAAKHIVDQIEASIGSFRSRAEVRHEMTLQVPARVDSRLESIQTERKKCKSPRFRLQRGGRDRTGEEA